MKNNLILVLCLIIFSSCIDPTIHKNKGEIVKNMANTLHLKFQDVEQISAKDVHNKLENKSFDYLIVDIRSVEHQNISIIPGAIGVNQFLPARDNFKDKLIIIYSTIGLGANELAQNLKKEGFSAKNLSGGTLAWAAENFDFFNTKNKVPTKEIFIENEAWRILPDNYIGVLP